MKNFHSFTQLPRPRDREFSCCGITSYDHAQPRRLAAVKMCYTRLSGRVVNSATFAVNEDVTCQMPSAIWSPALRLDLDGERINSLFG